MLPRWIDKAFIFTMLVLAFSSDLATDPETKAIFLFLAFGTIIAMFLLIVVAWRK